MLLDGAASTTASRPVPVSLALASHPGPTVAVTLLSGLLCVAGGVGTGSTAVLVAAVLAGQLSIGWSNDLADLARDRRSGRTDKPLASGALTPRTVRVACAVAVVLTLLLSAALGPRAAAALLAVVAGGWAYNLGLKATAWSWLPYAAAFGSLAVAPSLVAGADVAWWLPTVGALLGVGAHLVNVLPDLDEDAATGVSGLPHRIAARCGRAGVSASAVVLFVVATALLLAQMGRGPLAWVTGAVVAVLAAAAMAARGRWPFLAAIGIALVDVVALAVAL